MDNCIDKPDMNYSAALSTKKKKKKDVSEVGFEPTPTYVDQKPRTRIASKDLILESGALDHSATLTLTPTTTSTSHFIRVQGVHSTEESLSEQTRKVYFKFCCSLQSP